MNLEELQELVETNPEEFLDFQGPCMDCKTPTCVTIQKTIDGVMISGGAVYKIGNDFRIKCDVCYQERPKIEQACEVFTRCVGYYRPVKNMHDAKRKEVAAREMFSIT